MSFSTLGYLFISAMCVIIIVTIIGIIYSGVAERNDRKTAERLEDERKNGDADVLPEIKEQSQEEESATKQSQNEDAIQQEDKARIKIFDKVAPRKVLYSDDCKYCRYGGYGAKERLCKYSCKGCDNAEIIDGKPICHCFDMLKVESKRPQCPYFKDKTED